MQLRTYMLSRKLYRSHAVLIYHRRNNIFLFAVLKNKIIVFGCTSDSIFTTAGSSITLPIQPLRIILLFYENIYLLELV